MPPDLALWLTLISSKFPCLEHIFMVPTLFEPLKFYCIRWFWFIKGNSLAYYLMLSLWIKDVLGGLCLFSGFFVKSGVKYSKLKTIKIRIWYWHWWENSKHCWWNRFNIIRSRWKNNNMEMFFLMGPNLSRVPSLVCCVHWIHVFTYDSPLEWMQIQENVSPLAHMQFEDDSPLA